jgi:hypothetical protein
MSLSGARIGLLKMTSFSIYKLRDGGYYVQQGSNEMERGMWNPPVFASAKIGECLEYIREQLEKAPAK